MGYPSIYTTKIPHHSRHSGYEQLISYLKATIYSFPRYSSTKPLQLSFERLLRRFSASKWYMQDGINMELNVWKNRRKKGVVHFLYGDSTIGIIPYFRKTIQSKLILTLHACPNDLEEIVQYPSLLRQIDGFVIMGENQREVLHHWDIPDERIANIPHGISREFFKPAPKSLSTDDTCTILTVGNWKRNFELLAEVSRYYAENDPRVQFKVVSQEYNRSYFRGCDNVLFMSGISDEELLREYQSAKLLFMPLTDAVANNVLLEAQSCGLPVICEDVGAVREYLPSEYPYFYSPHSVQHAITQIEHLRQNQSALNYWSGKVVTHANLFDWNTIAEKTEAFYSKIESLPAV